MPAFRDTSAAMLLSFRFLVLVLAGAMFAARGRGDEKPAAAPPGCRRGGGRLLQGRGLGEGRGRGSA